jgi:Thioredoxin domain
VIYCTNKKGTSIVLNVKILGLQYPERYVVRRLVAAAQQELLTKCVPLDLEIDEITDPGVIGKYAFVLVLPTLVINEIVVCSGRFPTKEEVTGWLLEAAEERTLTEIPLP